MNKSVSTAQRPEIIDKRSISGWAHWLFCKHLVSPQHTAEIDTQGEMEAGSTHGRSTRGRAAQHFLSVPLRRGANPTYVSTAAIPNCSTTLSTGHVNVKPFSLATSLSCVLLLLSNASVCRLKWHRVGACPAPGNTVWSPQRSFILVDTTSTFQRSALGHWPHQSAPKSLSMSSPWWDC